MTSGGPRAQALQQVLATCLREPTDLNLDTLLACDYSALILAMRRVTFGNDCDCVATCPACDKQETYTVDLSQLMVYPGDPQLVQRQLQDPQATHLFTLPQCGRRAHFRLCSGKQMTELASANRLAQPHATGPLLHTLLQRLCRIEGLEQSGTPLKVFVRDQLSAGDAAAFLQFYQQVEPGYDDEVHLTCPHCHSSFEHTLSLEAAHFFPAFHRKRSYGRPN